MLMKKILISYIIKTCIITKRIIYIIYTLYRIINWKIIIII